MHTFLVTVVSKSIPLTTTLRINIQMIIIHNPLRPIRMTPILHLPPKRWAPKRREQRQVQVPVQRDTITSLDLLGCCSDGIFGYEIECT
jgi:hypothetical protein